MVTAIVNARVFDGDGVLGTRCVVIDGGVIDTVGGDPPPGAEIVDGSGATLLPGLIDAHVHTNRARQEIALRFGVTTTLEMQGGHTRDQRSHIVDDDTLADVRSAGAALTPPGGHPSELFPPDHPAGPPPDGASPPPPVRAFVTTPDEATAAVPRLVETGSDFIKFMVDDGSVEGHPGIPMLDAATLEAGVAAAHRHGMLTVAHALTIDTTRMAIDAGVDGLVHLFLEPHDDQIIDLVARSGAFVVPCAVVDAALIGINGADLADDPRVSSRLDPTWVRVLRGSFGHYPQGRISDVLASVRALHRAGVDLLVGTDASHPWPFMGGLAHGASVHRELGYLVAAGLSPIQALHAATTATARRFGLHDRGRIAEGLRADLLLVDGDPTADIDHTLDIRHVWRRGTRLGRTGVPSNPGHTVRPHPEETT